MLDIYQKTISNPISFEGIGLHSGKSSKITILPGKVNQGIVFKRIDIKKWLVQKNKPFSMLKDCLFFQ